MASIMVRAIMDLSLQSYNLIGIMVLRAFEEQGITDRRKQEVALDQGGARG